jgi:hypothetical protein
LGILKDELKGELAGIPAEFKNQPEQLISFLYEEAGTEPNAAINYIIAISAQLSHLDGEESEEGNESQLPAVTGSYRQLPVVTGSYRQLPAITGNYRQLPAVTGSYRQLPAVTGASCANPPNRRPQLNHLDGEESEEGNESHVKVINYDGEAPAENTVDVATGESQDTASKTQGTLPGAQQTSPAERTVTEPATEAGGDKEGVRSMSMATSG